jgi:hypothetical protein
MRTSLVHLVHLVHLACLTASVALVFACSGAPAAPVVAAAPDVDLAPTLRGVPDHGNDPAVVLIDAAGQGWCTGALLEEDVVLTSRRCLELTKGTLECPPHGPQIEGPRDLTTVRVLVGDDIGTAIERARGLDVLMPGGDVLCGDDIALLVLDAAIDDVTPFTVSPAGAARGDHVRSVAFGASPKLVRDHVPVTATSDRELALDEAPCVGTPGGALVDETTGLLVGVVSRSAPSCNPGDGWDIATRPDAFFTLVEQALSLGHVSHATGKAKEKKGAIDLGASCAQATECAAGACVSYQAAQYCTRRCSPTDKCPTHYKCMDSQQSTTVCVEE